MPVFFRNLSYPGVFLYNRFSLGLTKKLTGTSSGRLMYRPKMYRNSLLTGDAAAVSHSTKQGKRHSK